MRTLTCQAVIAVSLVFTSATSPSRAAVYRCVLDDGHVSYQQVACSAHSKPMQLRNHSRGWSPLRPGERALLNSYRKEDQAPRRGPPAQPVSRAKESESCWNKRKQLEAVRSKLRRGYALKESATLHRERDNHADYLRRFCS